MVGTISNLVNEVLQAAVGNHFRDKLQSMPAVEFIETRQQVQQAALAHISAQLTQYEVETRGVYIQDVILPKELGPVDISLGKQLKRRGRLRDRLSFSRVMKFRFLEKVSEKLELRNVLRWGCGYRGGGRRVQSPSR